MVKKFLRRDTARFSKLGKRRKKLLKWRRPTGRDNKMREKRKGYPAVVKVGYKNEKKSQEIAVKTLKDLENIGKEKEILLGKMGKKKKLEIVLKVKEMKMKIKGLNIEKFLKQNQKPEKNTKKEETKK